MPVAFIFVIAKLAERAVAIQLDDRLSAYGLGSFGAPLLATTVQ